MNENKGSIEPQDSSAQRDVKKDEFTRIPMAADVAEIADVAAIDVTAADVAAAAPVDHSDTANAKAVGDAATRSRLDEPKTSQTPKRAGGAKAQKAQNTQRKSRAKSLVVGGVIIAVLAVVGIVIGVLYSTGTISSASPEKSAEHYISALKDSNSKGMCEVFSDKMLDTTIKNDADAKKDTREDKLNACAKIIERQVTPDRVKELKVSTWKVTLVNKTDKQAVIVVKNGDGEEVGVLGLAPQGDTWKVVDPTQQAQINKEYQEGKFTSKK